MAEESDAKMYQRTRDTLGKIIKKPPLNDRLLSRPPFRFLHDVIMEVLKNTKFFNGLYSGKELDSKGEWDREAKVSFLQKAIDVVVFTTGSSVKARPSKIVAGLESDKTNEFLQILGIAILKKLDSGEAIQKVLRGERPSQVSEKRKHKVDNSDSSREVVEESKKVSEKKQEKENKEPVTSDNIKGSATDITSDVTSDATSDVIGNEQPIIHDRPTHRPGTRRNTRDRLPGRPARDDLSSEGSGSPLLSHDRPSSAKGKRKLHTDDVPQSNLVNKEEEGGVEDQTTPLTNGPQSPSPPTIHSGLVPIATRPSSARPPPPRVIKKVTEAQLDSQRVSSGSEKPPNIIMDTTAHPDDDDDNEEEEIIIEQSSHSTVALPGEGGAQGVLTQTLMAAQKRYEGEREDKSTAHTIAISEAQRRREREMVEKEVAKLQKLIQSLCQSANPLGKIMDYVQEDLDSMQRELTTWRKENAQHIESLRREERITVEELNPLRGQLSEIEAKISEQLDLISSSKANIIKNDERILQMLSSFHSPH